MVHFKLIDDLFAWRPVVLRGLKRVKVVIDDVGRRAQQPFLARELRPQVGLDSGRIVWVSTF
eukprot:2971557-Rhodomonas_salina.1